MSVEHIETSEELQKNFRRTSEELQKNFRRTSDYYSKLRYFSKYRYLRTFLLKTINWRSCLFISFSFSFSIPVHAEDRARRVLQLLQKLNIYHANQIRLLTNSQATRPGILDGLEWLVSGVGCGEERIASVER